MWAGIVRSSVRATNTPSVWMRTILTSVCCVRTILRVEHVTDASKITWEILIMEASVHPAPTSVTSTPPSVMPLCPPSIPLIGLVYQRRIGRPARIVATTRKEDAVRAASVATSDHPTMLPLLHASNANVTATATTAILNEVTVVTAETTPNLHVVTPMMSLTRASICSALSAWTTSSVTPP